MALKIPCFLCGDLLPIKPTKKDKPVVTCNSCGVQSFVRYPKGIERLNALAENRASLMGDFVLCGDCQIALKKINKNISRPSLRSAGIYCPRCDSLLLKVPEGDWK